MEKKKNLEDEMILAPAYVLLSHVLGCIIYIQLLHLMFKIGDIVIIRYARVITDGESEGFH